MCETNLESLVVGEIRDELAQQANCRGCGVEGGHGCLGLGLDQEVRNKAE